MQRAACDYSAYRQVSKGLVVVSRSVHCRIALIHNNGVVGLISALHSIRQFFWSATVLDVKMHCADCASSLRKEFKHKLINT